MKKEWRAVVGYEGKYEVSSLGNVRSLDRLVVHKKRNGVVKCLYKGKLLEHKWTKGLYDQIYISREKQKYVHRLVAQAFIPNPENKPQVNHLDNNPSNNNVSNLEWTTQKENMEHCAKQGRNAINIFRGESHPNSKLKNIDVIKIREMKGKKSNREIGKVFGVSKGAVQRIISRTGWTHI